MITCPQCGTQNLPGMAYCEHCGSPLKQEEAPLAQAPGGHLASASAASSQAQTLLDSLKPEDSPAADEQTADHVAPVHLQQPAQPQVPADQEAQPQQEEAQPPRPLPIAASAQPAVLALSITFTDGATFDVTSDLTNVGRSDVAQNWHPELDLIPFGGGAPDFGVSRHQALIQRDGQSFTMVDVGSTNGTFVNGKALEYNKPVPLQDGDAIAFGAFNAKLSIR